MKKSFTLLTGAVMASSLAFAQGNDTLLFNDFEVDPATYMMMNAPSGTTNDPNWVNFDADGLADASTQGNRPGEWFWTLGYASVDSSDAVMGSNSWTNPASLVMNWLITPVIQIVDNTAMLSWKSAPFQTPKYLDGYLVLASTTDNLESSFTDTLFVGAEYISHNNTSDSSFSAFTFSPANAFVHGQDGQYIEYGGDSLRFTGVLRPFSQSLAAYSGGHVYIAFVHYTVDDNLLSLDDVLITGTDATSIDEVKADISLNVYPNPATGTAIVNYELSKESPVFINVYDVNGKLVKTEAKGLQVKGAYTHTIGLDGLAFGYYNVVVRTSEGSSTIKLLVK